MGKYVYLLIPLLNGHRQLYTYAVTPFLAGTTCAVAAAAAASHVVAPLHSASNVPQGSCRRCLPRCTAAARVLAHA